MTGDLNNFPVGGGTILALFLYALLSLFVTGPIIGERMIEKAGWPAHCQAALKAELETSGQMPGFQPKLDCPSLLSWLGPDGQKLCRQGGLKLPFMDQMNAYQDRLDSFNEQRLESAVSKTRDRCECAAALTLENRRTAFAITAGSARLIVPSPVKNLSSELTAALHMPACQMKEVTP